MLRAMGSALSTDLYELNMAASYLRRGMTAPATFSLFVRNLPPGWGFLVACGLERCLEYLEEFRFTDQDLDYLRSQQGFSDDMLEAFAGLRFTGQVRAVPEGRLVFADEPLLEVTAPLPEAQLVETYLLNQVTYQTAVASKAARCRLAAPEASLVDFSFRRVHGMEAGVGVARATAMVGFEATSNVEAARLLGLRATGTMAHSYVEAFASEMDAFRAYAEDFPDRVMLLVDTYDTARGVEKAIKVAGELAQRGTKLQGIRLDSGDLAQLAKEARRALDAAGLTEVQILASGGLDEHAIAGLVESGAPIDAYGGFSKVGVPADSPTLDSVYKLVQYDGEPLAKLSTDKATLPGPKQVWRIRGMAWDVIGLAWEEGPEDGEALLVPVIEGGSRTFHEGLPEATLRFDGDLRALPAELRTLDAKAPLARRTPELNRLAEEVRERIRTRELS
jgi:nicotinate phosphoribosyltransferase